MRSVPSTAATLSVRFASGDLELLSLTQIHVALQQLAKSFNSSASTLERLNLRCLVNAQHDRVVRRVHIQANNVAYLFDEVRGLWPSILG